MLALYDSSERVNAFGRLWMPQPLSVTIDLNLQMILEHVE